MGSIQISIVPVEDSIEEIIAVVKEVFEIGGEDVIDIESELSDLIDQMVTTLYVVIETSYVDKFYRDSYYTYFASKHREYKRDCIRLSFFKDEITDEHFRNPKLFNVVQELFLGYSILRPTVPRIVGRSIINKNAFSDNDMLICSYKSNVLVNGVKLDISGFPHSSQDSESITCAETTIWGLMEYFGNRYPDYRPIAISGIISVLTKYSKKRMLPSAGLTVDQISYAIKEFGFGTYIYSREDAYEDAIENVISIYVESGIPVLAALENTEVGHAILVVGYEQESEIKFESQKTRSLEYHDKTISYVDYTDVERKYVIQDDNLHPLQKVLLSKPDQPYMDKGLDEWRDVKIDSVIVPLYRRIYLEAEMAKELALNILKDKDLGYQFDNQFVFRFYLTSSRSFKHHIAILENIDDILANELILQKMPKFIWVAEMYQKDDYQGNLATGLIVIDATEASQNAKDAVLAAMYPDRCIFKSGSDFVTLDQNLSSYYRFQNNLT